MRLVTPSASACSCAHRSSQTASTASSSSSWLGVISLAPEASSSTVSLVEQLPSTSSRSKVRAVGAAQRLVQCVGVGDGVGGDDAQHRGQRRRQHARALGHPADGPVAVMMQRNLFGHGVGGHDGLRCFFTAGESARQLVHDLVDPGQHLVHRQPVADQARLSRRRPRSRRSRCPSPTARPRPPRRWRACPGNRRAGACVGAAGVQDHRAQPAGGQHLLRPQHRRGLDLVAGEHRGGGVVGSLVEHQRQIRLCRRP